VCCVALCCSVLQRVAVWCCVLLRVAACCSNLQWSFAFSTHSMPPWVRVCCNVLQCVAVCCNVLQCVAMCCSVLIYWHIYTYIYMHIMFQTSPITKVSYSMASAVRGSLECRVIIIVHDFHLFFFGARLSVVFPFFWPKIAWEYNLRGLNIAMFQNLQGSALCCFFQLHDSSGHDFGAKLQCPRWRVLFVGWFTLCFLHVYRTYIYMYVHMYMHVNLCMCMHKYI